MDLTNRLDYEREMSGTVFFRMSITDKWRRGLVSNFEYLMHLNTLSGRSFNDLTQYPVFPFLLADYTSESLDLAAATTFRELSKPMGAQDPDRLQKFLNMYEQTKEMDDPGPYHYGSHYSNTGVVLHFLVRVEPFARFFIEFQDGGFDIPDRSFHSIQQTWRLSSKESSTDVKELIPEMFCLPQLFVNQNHFDMGVKQNHERVDDVFLPPWANEARSFIQQHRQALESDYVSERLHHWIDLIFGFKQKGDAALAACNLFYPLTYEGAVDIDSITDELERQAKLDIIDQFGQTPKQLFTKPHPQKSPRSRAPTVFSHAPRFRLSVLGNVPTDIGYLDIVDDQPVALPAKRILFFPENRMISWGHWDYHLRICAIDTGKVVAVIETPNRDDTLCAAAAKNGRVLMTGGASSLVRLWTRTWLEKRKQVPQMRLSAVMQGHSGAVISIALCENFGIAVTGSHDTTAIIWDLQRQCYVRSLLGHDGPVVAVAISSTRVCWSCVIMRERDDTTNHNIINNNLHLHQGDIVTADQTKQGSTIRLWSINGELLSSIQCFDMYACDHDRK